MNKGVSAGDISRWAKEHDEAERDLRLAEPTLVALEEEQVKKRLEKYRTPALGDLALEKPEGFQRFMSLQLNGTATKLRSEGGAVYTIDQ
jgi:hypothetical protein